MFIKLVHKSFSNFLQSSTFTCANEKLAAISVGSRVGHGELTRAVVAAMGEAFVLKLIPRPSTTRSLGAATLDHEAGNHPVEDDAVVEPF